MTFNKSFTYLALALLSLFIVGIRTVNLDVRPPHHDESIHATYSFYEYHDSKNLSYKYDPMLHGPLLYRLTAKVFTVFGPSLKNGRIFTALIHSLAIFIIALTFYRRAGLTSAVFALVALGLSPVNLLWSRFLREDAFMMLLMALSFWGLSLNAKHLWRIPLAILFFMIQFTSKENAFMTLGLLIFYAFFEVAFNYALFRKLPIIETFKKNCGLKELVICFLGGAFIYCYLLSNGFTYNQGIIDGLYRKSLMYWFHQHKIERISGPFFYNFLVLSWYDFLFLVSTVFFFFLTKLENIKYHLIGFTTTLILSLIAVLTIDWVQTPFFIDQVLKFKHPFDVIVACMMLFMGAATTLDHLLKNERELAFFGFFFWANWFSYSYVGEKVPWLTLYPLFFGVLYYGLLIAKREYLDLIAQNRKIIIPVLSILLTFQLITLYRSGLRDEGHAHELASQVHTTWEFDSLLSALRSELLTNTPEDVKYRVYLNGDPVWPGTWYLYSLKGYGFNNSERNFERFNDMVVDHAFLNSHIEIGNTHQITPVPFRHWWLPNWIELSPINWFNYLVWREPWNPVGKTDVFHLKSLKN